MAKARKDSVLSETRTSAPTSPEHTEDYLPTEKTEEVTDHTDNED